MGGGESADHMVVSVIVAQPDQVRFSAFLTFEVGKIAMTLSFNPTQDWLVAKLVVIKTTVEKHYALS